MAAEELRCPKCKQIDKVQKVSVLYSGGISTVEYDTWRPPPPKSGLPPLRMTEQAVSQTMLSQRLTPPAKPTAKFPHWIWVLLGVVGAPIVCCSTVETPEEGGLYYFLIIGGVILAGMFAVYFARQQRVAEQMPRWEKAVSRWHQLYYCGRCDGVFAPGETPLLSAERMGAFLYLWGPEEEKERQQKKLWREKGAREAAKKELFVGGAILIALLLIVGGILIAKVLFGF
jgi:hypothetical protein